MLCPLVLRRTARVLEESLSEQRLGSGSWFVHAATESASSTALRFGERWRCIVGVNSSDSEPGKHEVCVRLDNLRIDLAPQAGHAWRGRLFWEKCEWLNHGPRRVRLIRWGHSIGRDVRSRRCDALDMHWGLASSRELQTMILRGLAPTRSPVQRLSRSPFGRRYHFGH